MTYANDSKQHCRQVLSLCNCLDRNGFSCCVDVNSRHDSTDQAQASREWCGRKFKEVGEVCPVGVGWDGVGEVCRVGWCR